MLKIKYQSCIFEVQMREMYCICTSKVPKIGTIPVSFGYISIGHTKKYMKCTDMIPE